MQAVYAITVFVVAGFILIYHLAFVATSLYYYVSAWINDDKEKYSKNFMHYCPVSLRTAFWPLLMGHEKNSVLGPDPWFHRPDTFSVALRGIAVATFIGLTWPVSIPILIIYVMAYWLREQKRKQKKVGGF